MNPENQSMGGLEEDMYGIMKSELLAFLKDFPIVKWQLEVHIKELHCAADRIDQIHKGCTITGMVASSAGVVSGVLTIVGLALAPVTAGASVALCVGGAGLGVGATVTGISASIIDNVSDSRGRAQLNDAEKKAKDIMGPLSESIGGMLGAFVRLNKTFRNIAPNARAFKLLRRNPGLISKTKQINKTFTGTVLAMTKQARIRGAVFSGIFVVMDIVAIVQDSMHLSKGAKAPTAAKLREKAQELEKGLQELSCVYETLRETEETQ